VGSRFGEKTRWSLREPKRNPLPETRIRIGISACLLGDEVRFDGGHKRDAFLTDVLGPHVEWVKVCPEVEVGMGTPRETLRLLRNGDELLMMTTRTGIDYTERMNRWSRKRTDELAREDLCGYVLKKDSPSCGMERVKVYGEGAVPARTGRGLFASALLERLPLLPVEEEGRLTDPHLRENFIERVFAYRRLTDLFGGKWGNGSVVRFHTSHKMALLAHSTTAYQRLGRLVATVAATPRQEFRRQYQQQFMDTLRLLATRKRHTNVLMHMAGHLTDGVDRDSRRELADTIDDYRRGLVPLVVPLTLVRHHVRVAGVEYLKGQTYLEPHPRELMLRNHV
jgi:uncharacterized protein YbgA (DUF1722 family)/uncharacterized protein YbbK (DUF523 family)